MPVRGHGWYKRPYKLKVTYNREAMAEHARGGPKVQTFSFHWKGARDKAAEMWRQIGYVTKVEVWDQPVDAVQVRDGA